MKTPLIATLLCASLGALVACDKPAPVPTKDAPLHDAGPSDANFALRPPPPTTLSLDRVTFDVPGRWTVEPPANSMRAAQFRIGAEATAAVFRGIRGGADFNIARWASQFIADDKQVETSERPIENARLHLFTGTGTFDGGAAMGGAGPQPDMMVLGVLIEISPEQSVYIKATGPRATLEPARADWNIMLDSIRVAPNAAQPTP